MLHVSNRISLSRTFSRNSKLGNLTVPYHFCFLPKSLCSRFQGRVHIRESVMSLIICSMINFAHAFVRSFVFLAEVSIAQKAFVRSVAWLHCSVQSRPPSPHLFAHKARGRH